MEAHLKPQQPSQDRSTENKTSREYRPGPPPKEQKESQPKKPSKAVAIYIGAMIVGSLFIGLDVLRVSLAEKREEEKQQAIAIKATRASEEVERLRLAATLEQQKKDEEAKVRKQKQELIDVSRRLATLEQQAVRAAEKRRTMPNFLLRRRSANGSGWRQNKPTSSRSLKRGWRARPCRRLRRLSLRRVKSLRRNRPLLRLGNRGKIVLG